MLLLIAIILLAGSLFLTSCGTLRTEFNSPAGTTNAPPISTQLTIAAPYVAAAVPLPWGAMIAALMNLAATGAATVAAFHARSAAASSASASDSASTASTAARPPTLTAPPLT